MVVAEDQGVKESGSYCLTVYRALVLEMDSGDACITMQMYFIIFFFLQMYFNPLNCALNMG